MGAGSAHAVNIFLLVAFGERISREFSLPAKVSSLTHGEERCLRNLKEKTKQQQKNAAFPRQVTCLLDGFW